MKHLLTSSLRGAQRRGNPQKWIASPSARNDALLFLLIILLFSSCTKSKQKQQERQISTTDTNTKTEQISTQNIDYDLSNMNFTMISSFFFQMLIEPETYENKTFKIKGKFQSFENEEDPAALPYFSVIMNDVTMCCQEGIDFQWQGEHNWPADYPQQDQEITIIGKYIVTETDGITYNYILASDILL